MKKLVKWLLVSLLAFFIAGSLCINTASAKVRELSPGVIAVDNTVYMSDFFEFYTATMDEKIKHYRIVLHTPGGDAATCIGIINRMLELKARGVSFTTEVFGVAASAGSYIFMMGDERIAHKGSILMWHTIEAQVNARGVRHRIDDSTWHFLSLMDNHIRYLFKRATGLSDKWVHYWLDSDVAQFMSATTAYAIGIATKMPAN